MSFFCLRFSLYTVDPLKILVVSCSACTLHLGKSVRITAMSMNERNNCVENRFLHLVVLAATVVNIFANV